MPWSRRISFIPGEACDMPYGLPVIQRPGRRGDLQAHDSGGAGLPRMSPPSSEPATAIEGQEMEAQKIERPQMAVDIACVGFGPAMGGFLTTLSHSLLNPDGSVRLESA